MNNDLISRSELKEALLKKALHDFFDGKVTDEPAYILRDVFCQIDGAPTVPLPDFKEGYKQAIIDGKTNFSRPQGEWKVYGKQGGIPITDMCSNCRYEMKWYKNKYKFCPNCGASMRNGGAE